jgi:4,5-DOPA dioxygenase extradiol
MQSLFLSHGAPDLLFADVPARAFLSGLAASLPRPRAIVVASAHWTTAHVEVGSSRAPSTIHDFGGFSQELHRFRYPAQGDPKLAADIVSGLREHDMLARPIERGLDHGAWVPLALAWPRADVPVLQVSLQPERGAAHHMRLGRALGAIVGDDVLVIGSGSATHDLGALAPPESSPPEWVLAFDRWLTDAALRGDEAALVDYKKRAPFAAQNHPTEEHFLPLLVAFGAAGRGARGQIIHSSTTYGVLSMSAFRFDGPPAAGMRQT